MTVARSKQSTANGWMSWALWAAGVTLLLMELDAGMQYFEAGLQQNMGNLGFVPALAMITFKVAQQSVWHWGTLRPILQAVPMAALGLLLVAIGLAASAQFAGADEKSVQN